MSQFEHPSISEMNRQGYLNLSSQPKRIDYFGSELLVGDDVVEFDGEIVLRENLMDFLEGLGFQFKTL